MSADIGLGLNVSGLVSGVGNTPSMGPINLAILALQTGGVCYIKHGLGKMKLVIVVIALCLQC